MDAQTEVYAEAGDADWAADAAAGMETIADDVPVLTPEDWEALRWDADRGDPKTVEQARRALAERISDAGAPDGDDETGAYDGLSNPPRSSRRLVVAPRGAGALWLLWLPDAVRSVGLPVVLVPGWESRGHGPMRVCEGVVGHHTGTAASAPGDYPSRNVVTNGRAGLAGPLCNLGLSRSGAVFVVAAGLAYHAGASRWAGFVDLNDEFVGIEAESDGSGAWTDAQRDAYPRLVGTLLRYMRRGTDRYISHRGCAVPAGRKPDPTGLADAWMRGAAERWTTANPPTPPADPTVATHTVVSGDTLWSLAMRYRVTVPQLQAWNALGSRTTLTVGQVLRVCPPDAPVAPVSTDQADLRLGSQGGAVRVLQTKLGRWYPSLGLAVDGQFGPHTQAAVIRAQVNTPPPPKLPGSGVVDAATRRKLGLS